MIELNFQNLKKKKGLNEKLNFLFLILDFYIKSSEFNLLLEASTMTVIKDEYACFNNNLSMELKSLLSDMKKFV